VRSQNFDKRLLALSCLSICQSVCLSAWNNSAPTGQIFMKFDIRIFFEHLSRKSSAIKFGQEKRVFYMKTNIQFLSYLAQFFLE